MKRAMDVAGGIVGLLAFAPVMGIVAALVLWKDGWPVLHREYRVGRGGALFGILKFRTLRVDAAGGRTVAPDDDPRITGTGHWLRRWRLDELPQLFNVVTGDMSLVGPRPMPPLHAAALPETERAELLSVRPGMTDPAALAFLAEDTVLAGVPDPEEVYLSKLLPAKTAIQLAYVRESTLFEDLRVLVRTLAMVWSRAQRRRSTELLERLLLE